MHELMSSSPTHFALGCWERAYPEWRQHPHYAELLGQVQAPPSWEMCWLCGGTHQEMVPRRLRLNEGFTNHGWAKAPRSEWLCLPCAVFLMSHPSARHYWRNQGHVFMVDPPYLRHPGRAEWRGVLLNPPAPPFLLCLPTSGQKHLVFRGTVARGREVFPLQYEEEQVMVEREVLRDLLGTIETLLAAGFRREELRSGRPNSRRVLTFGLKRYVALERRIIEARQLRPLHLELALRVAWEPERGRDAGVRN